MKSFNGNAPKQVEERRRFGRRSVFKRAQLLIEGADPIDCLVTNESTGGVGLQISPGPEIHGSFYLHIPSDDVVVQCRVSHRAHNRLGAEFTRSPQRASRLNSRTSVQIREMLAHAAGAAPKGLLEARSISGLPKRVLVE